MRPCDASTVSFPLANPLSKTFRGFSWLFLRLLIFKSDEFLKGTISLYHADTLHTNIPMKPSEFLLLASSVTLFRSRILLRSSHGNQRRELWERISGRNEEARRSIWRLMGATRHKIRTPVDPLKCKFSSSQIARGFAWKTVIMNFELRSDAIVLHPLAPKRTKRARLSRCTGT